MQDKIQRSIDLIRKAEKLANMYDPENGFFLAFSGGKDSQALYHIAQMAGVKFKAHFSPTTVDPPQVIRFIRKYYPDVVFEKVTKSIYDVAVEKGILPTQKVRWCCAEFKENAGAGKVTLIGIRHAESVRRSKRNEMEVSNRKFSGTFEQFEKWQEEKLKKQYKNLNQDQFSYDKPQEVRCINGKDSILVSPIIDWTERDVWTFLNDIVKVPHCELYDQGYKRIGCILCPMSSHKQKMREMRDFPHVKKKWLDTIKKIRQGGGITVRTYTPPQCRRVQDSEGGQLGDISEQATRTSGTHPAGAYIRGGAETWSILPQLSMGGQTSRQKIHQRTMEQVMGFAIRQRLREWRLSLTRMKSQRIFSIGGLAGNPTPNGTQTSSYNNASTSIYDN